MVTITLKYLLKTTREEKKEREKGKKKKKRKVESNRIIRQ